ncbi:MAG: type IV secretory system conjugative DNA transfer family protein [Clostridia bacterium]|nr:type IV secretory system conjugative DNA transfer family protein [Clostridia bacterium]
MGSTHRYDRYMVGNQETRWSTVEEMKRAGTYVDLFADTYPVAGLPLLSDGKEAYVDGADTHTLIFGATGSKKTRLFCMPLIGLFAGAGESFVVTDPKGELYAKTAGFVKSKGYKTVVLNFRDIGRGDMWNPLALPYEMYHSENKEQGISMLNDFVNTIAEPQKANTKDVFWPEMASAYALANLLLMAECGTAKEMNVGSLSGLCSTASEKVLTKLAERMSDETIAGLNYKGVLAGAENTRRSIFAVLYGMVRIFNTQPNLTKMLSGNTVDMRRFGREKTAVYIIVPDEKTTYHFLVTTFIKQAYEVLISEAQKEKNFRLPVRVNFVLDEFCNIPKVPDMPAMISAARSRNMRYFLVAQSMHQLKGKYGEDADTIKGNCDNWVFLTSKELSLLQEISALCGEIYTADGRRRAMISVSELQRFDKQKGETLIMQARQYPIITEMADIDMYEAFKGYTAPKQRAFRMPQVAQFSVDTLLNDILAGKKPFPFTATHEMEITLPQAKPQKPKKKSAPKKKTIAQDTKLQEKAAQTYENLYGRKDGKK